MTQIVEIQDRGATELLNRLEAFGRDPSPVMAEIGDALAQSTRLRFLEGKSPTGETWAPLAKSTILKRARRARGARRARIIAGPHQPLMDTRTHLFNTVTYRVEQGGKSIVIGVAPTWGSIHQKGGYAGRGRATYIPARPYLGVSSDDQREIGGIITRQLLAISTTSSGAAS